MFRPKSTRLRIERCCPRPSSRHWLSQIGIVSIGGLGGVVHSLPTYAVWLGVHDRSPTAFKVVGSPDESWVLLGRDVINAERLFLDGPGLALELD